MFSVTLAVPCFNGAKFIARTIEALLSQSTPATSILLIDDGSTDDSADVIRSFPVHLISHEKNLGLSQARNTAIEHANTEIIAFVDADAYADQEMLASLSAVFKANPSLAGAGGQGIEAVRLNIYDEWRALHAVQGHGPRPKQQCDHLFGLCMAYRIDALNHVGGFDIRLRTNGEDIDIGYRLNAAGYQLAYTPKAIVYHQRQDTHESLRRMMRQWYYWGALVRKKNGRSPYRLALGTLRRLLWSDTLPDLVVRRSPKLARLDIEMAFVKFAALRDARRDTLMINR